MWLKIFFKIFFLFLKKCFLVYSGALGSTFHLRRWSGKYLDNQKKFLGNSDYLFGCLCDYLFKQYFWQILGVKIREKFLTRHKFTNLLKSVSWPWFMPREICSWKNIKMKLTLLKKLLKVVHFIDVFSSCVQCI